jgi:hypothetical protein
MAKQLRVQATTLARLGLPNQAHLINGVAEHCDARSLYEERATLRASHRPSWIVKRRSNRFGRNGDFVRGFIIMLAKVFTVYFGKRLLGVIATITNVGFERRDLTADRIRGVFER